MRNRLKMNCHHQTECKQWLCWKYSGLFSRLSSFLCHPINNLMFELVGRGHKREEGAQVSLQRDSPLRGKIQYECWNIVDRHLQICSLQCDKIFYNIHKLQFTFNWCLTTLNFPPKIIFIIKVLLNLNNVVSRYKRKTALVTSCKRKSQSHKSMSSPLLKSTMAMEPAWRGKWAFCSNFWKLYFYRTN